MGRGREGEDEGFSFLAQLWNPPLALTQALELPLALTPESKDINSERHGLAPAGLERGGTRSQRDFRADFLGQPLRKEWWALGFYASPFCACV